MFRPYKWAIIRLLVEPMGRLYTTPQDNVRRDLVPPPKLLVYSLPIGSTNNLMMTHL